MSKRLDYWKIAPEATRRMAAINGYLKESAIEASLRHLIWLRTSQINGCAYCVDLHASEALQDGERIERINCLVAWQETTLFTPKERAALAWTEALTNIAMSHAPEQDYALVREQFSDEDLVDLTLMIASMNAWNRMAIAFRRQPGMH